MNRKTTSLAVCSLVAIAVFAVACSAPVEAEAVSSSTNDLTQNDRMPRYSRIRDAASARGIANAYLLAGIAMDETNLAQCWSEATWACPGPSSPDCGGGAVIAGSADGPCNEQQGGLGMFQFDAGTYNDTLRTYSNDVLTVDGQVAHAIDYVVNMVKISDYTTDAETDDKARAWINRFDPNNGMLRDQWIRTVVRYYNGCDDCNVWQARYNSYSAGLSQVLSETGGTAFWVTGTSCPNGSGVTMGAIDEKYRALGGCGSVLGAPITNEQGTPDGIGRYSVFEHGSIYWTPTTGAYAVIGVIRDRWAALNWEVGALGYPTTDEVTTPDGIGRYNVFVGGSIYWTDKTGAHEVFGRIRDAWAAAGWEAGALGYPISGEQTTASGKQSEFEHGSITWSSATDATTIIMSTTTAGKTGGQ